MIAMGQKLARRMGRSLNAKVTVEGGLMALSAIQDTLVVVINAMREAPSRMSRLRHAAAVQDSGYDSAAPSEQILATRKAAWNFKDTDLESAMLNDAFTGSFLADAIDQKMTQLILSIYFLSKHREFLSRFMSGHSRSRSFANGIGIVDRRR